MSPHSIHNRKDLKSLRQQLRTGMTPAEQKLWAALKNRQLQGRKFRRQQSIGQYIVDFYCPSERLIIELDGPEHTDLPRHEYDQARQQELESFGYGIIRFENRMVFEQLDNVLEAIVQAFAPEGEPTTP
jgi:very-short-patch-repair endonuclease